MNATVTEYGFMYAQLVADAGVPVGAATARLAWSTLGASLVEIGKCQPARRIEVRALLSLEARVGVGTLAGADLLIDLVEARRTRRWCPSGS